MWHGLEQARGMLFFKRGMCPGAGSRPRCPRVRLRWKLAISPFGIDYGVLHHSSFYLEHYMETIQQILYGFSVVFQPMNLTCAFLGAIVGTLVGVLPGLGPVGAMSILLPVTYGMPPIGAVIMLAGIYYGAQYGGSTTSILVNIPGESASVVTCLDGYQMDRQGRAGAALGIAAFACFFAGT